MVFTMPANGELKLQAVRPEGTKEEPKGYCDDCSCGKKEQQTTGETE
jgi:hypothetical protein